MDKQAIIKTAVCRFDDSGKYYVVESPLCDLVMGAHPKSKEAWKIFHEILDETYIAYLEGQLVSYQKAGRPRKNGVACNLLVSPDAKDHIMRSAKTFNISQGEFVTYLCVIEQALKEMSDRGETPYKVLANEEDFVSKSRSVSYDLVSSSSSNRKVGIVCESRTEPTKGLRSGASAKSTDIRKSARKASSTGKSAARKGGVVRKNAANQSREVH